MQERPGVWEWQGRAIRGTEHLYEVEDGNLPALNVWSIAVKVPETGKDSIVVQPLEVPEKKVWSGIQRRSVLFPRATKAPYRNRPYCKVFLADSEGEKNRLGVRGSERRNLPGWFAPFRSRMREKEKVAGTRGTDGKSLVILPNPADHATLIGLFFAMKVWVLQEGFRLRRR